MYLSMDFIISNFYRTDIVQVAAGHAFNLVLTREGKIFTWGRNEQGQVRKIGMRRRGR
jgi:alpha-tubulin suppressor-like RCC1 family protein